MKKIISKLFFVALAILLFTGCGNEEKSIYALKWNVMFSPDISENVEKAQRSVDRMRESVIKHLIYRENPLEDVESATVSDGTYTITLGMHLQDLIYDEEELPKSEVVVDNRVTDLVVEGFAHGIFFHSYNDFTLYTGAFNHLNGDFEGYYTYIHQIILITARFQTSDGFRVGMSEKELKDFYGDKLGEKMKWGDDGYYYALKTNDNVSTRFVINMEGVIKEIDINTDYGKYY